MKIEIYEATDGFRWRLKARNGKVLADSGESYKKRLAVCKAVDRILSAIRDDTIEIVWK